MAISIAVKSLNTMHHDSFSDNDWRCFQ